jgi:hypothetical protein
MSVLRFLVAPLALVASVAVGSSIGFVFPVGGNANLVLWPAVLVQTIVSVGSLPPTWIKSPEQRGEALFLLGVHHLIATLPYAAIWFALGSEARASPTVIGLLCLAIVPTSAGLPAYAAAAAASPITITGFAVSCYLVALVATPILGLLIFGGADNLLGLVASIGLGLILPAILALRYGAWVRRIPPAVRTGIIAVAMVGTTYVFGGSLSGALASANLSKRVVAVALAAGVGRVALSALVGRLAATRRPKLRTAAMLSTSFKNDALAASIAVQAGGPVAVLPAVGSLVAEMALMLGVSLFAARRASGVGNAEYQAAQTNTSGTQPAQPA